MGSDGRAVSTLQSQQRVGDCSNQLRDVILLLHLSGVSLIFIVMVTMCLKSTWTKFQGICVFSRMSILQYCSYLQILQWGIKLNQQEAIFTILMLPYMKTVLKYHTDGKQRWDTRTYISGIQQGVKKQKGRDCTEISIIYEST